jgi:hypothetical protein
MAATLYGAHSAQAQWWVNQLLPGQTSEENENTKYSCDQLIELTL